MGCDLECLLKHRRRGDLYRNGASFRLFGEPPKRACEPQALPRMLLRRPGLFDDMGLRCGISKKQECKLAA